MQDTWFKLFARIRRRKTFFFLFRRRHHLSFCNWLCNSIRCQSKYFLVGMCFVFLAQLRNWCCLFDKWNVKWIYMFVRRCKGFHFGFRFSFFRTLSLSLFLVFVCFISVFRIFSECIWYFVKDHCIEGTSQIVF